MHHSSAWMRPQRSEMADFNLSGFERQSNRKLCLTLTLLCSQMSLLLFLLKSFLILAFFEGLSTEIFPNTMQGDEMQGLRWTVCSVLPGCHIFLIVKIERKKGSVVKFLPCVEEREKERERERERESQREGWVYGACRLNFNQADTCVLSQLFSFFPTLLQTVFLRDKADMPVHPFLYARTSSPKQSLSLLFNVYFSFCIFLSWLLADRLPSQRHIGCAHRLTRSQTPVTPPKGTTFQIEIRGVAG